MSGLIIPSYSQGFARYADESEAPEQWKGLVAALPIFLGPTGVTLHDPVGKHNGILTNMDPGTDWVATRDKWGNPIYALALDGVDDLVDSSFIPPDEITVSLWVKANDTTAGDRIWEAGEGLRLIWWNNTFNLYGTGLGADLYGDNVVIVGQWYHVAVTWKDQVAVQLYVNGVLNDSDSSIGDVTLIRFQLGTLNATPFNGLAYEVCIYNRILNAAEIWQQFIDPYAMWRLADVRLGMAAAVAGMPMPLLMQQMNQLNGGAML